MKQKMACTTSTTTVTKQGEFWKGERLEEGFTEERNSIRTLGYRWQKTIQTSLHKMEFVGLRN